jgi:putative ABC transport system permease protein
LTVDNAEDIANIQGVEASIHRIIESGTLEFNDIQRFGAAVSVPDGENRDIMYEIGNLEVERGRLLKDGDSSKIMIGHNLGEEDNTFRKALGVGSKVLVNDKQFEVVGILKNTGSFFIDGTVFMNDEPLRELVDNENQADLIAVKVKGFNDIDRTKENIEKYLRKERDVEKGEEDFSVESAQSTIDTINDVLGAVQAFVIIIAAISMVVGAIGIINTMFTAVLERRREIGIMKSIGARNSDVFYLFFIESGLLGMLGGLIGLMLGSLAAYAGTSIISNFLGLNATPDISLALIIGTLTGSFLVGAASGVIPAMQAAKMNPVDALRG